MHVRPLSVLSFIAVASCSALPDSAPEAEDFAPRDEALIGGTRDEGDPAVVLVKAQQGNMGWWCSGTVIAKRLVLTAAHCVEDAGSSTKFSVMFGTESATSKPSDYIAVKSWAHDPQFMATNNIAAGHDAAVLILASDAPVEPLPINYEKLTQSMIGTKVHVVGFGNTDGWAGTGSGIKREIFTTLTGLYQGVADVGHKNLTTCQGDSGGPTFMDVGGKNVIIGITSFGEVGCVGAGSVTRVDLSAAWIDPYIQANGGAPDGGGDNKPDPENCTPSCDGRVCGSDGCSGVCGACASGETCSAAGKCDAPAPPPAPSGCGESEPNGSSGSANALCSDGTQTGFLTASYDQDWYTFTVAANQTYTIDLTTDRYYVMSLYKIHNGWLTEITSAFDQIQKTTPNGGTYYLEVWGGNGDHSTSDPYDVRVDLTP